MLSFFPTQIAAKLALIIASATFVATGTTPLFSQPSTNSSPTLQQNLDSLIAWKTGRQLDRFTTASISASWTEADLRDRLINFAQTQKAAIFIDRRIDPSQLINITMNNVSPEQFLWSIAKKQSIGVSRVGDFYYFGPPTTAASLPTLWKQLRSESSKQKLNYQVDWTKRAPIKTGQVVNVKTLLEELASENKFQIENLDEIPHDIWSQFELPRLSLDGRVAILLVGFDKWFERSADGKSIRIVNFKAAKRAEFQTTAIDDPRETAKKLRPNYPGLKIVGTKTRLSASGPPMEMAKLRADLINGQAVEKVKLEDILYPSVKTRTSRLGFLQAVAAQVNRKVTFDRKHQPKLDEQINLELEKVTVFELLDATLNGSGLKYEISDTELRIMGR